MKLPTNEQRRADLAAQLGKRWTHPPPSNLPLHYAARVPVSLYGPQHEGQEFSLFEGWRPIIHTVRQLMEIELCPASYQAKALVEFRLAWAKPSAVYAWMLEEGERLYTFTPKANRARWNDRYLNWCRAAWAQQVHQFQTTLEVRGEDRVWLSDYIDLFERCLGDPKWSRAVPDYHFRNPECSKHANFPAAVTRAGSACRA